MATDSEDRSKGRRLATIARAGCRGAQQTAERAQALSRIVFELERLGDRLVADLSVRDVEPIGEVGVARERLIDTEVRKLEREGQSGVVEREGAGARDGPRHVRDAIMDDPVHL